jgi:hypothetical protein
MRLGSVESVSRMRPLGCAPLPLLVAIVVFSSSQSHAGQMRLALAEPECDPNPIVVLVDGLPVAVSGDGKSFAILHQSSDDDRGEVRIVALDGKVLRRFVLVKPGDCPPPRGRRVPLVPARVKEAIKAANAFLRKGRYRWDSVVELPEARGESTEYHPVRAGHDIRVELEVEKELLTVAYRGKVVLKRRIAPLRIKVTSKAPGLECDVREARVPHAWLWWDRLLVSIHYLDSEECHPNPPPLWLPPIVLPTGEPPATAPARGNP